MEQRRRIILASNSPRRKKLLEQIGLKFEIRASSFNEDTVKIKDPAELAKFLALKKAEEIAAFYDDAIIIGADTLVILDKKPMGKPKDEEDAKRILQVLSGEENVAITGYALIDTKKKMVINDYDQAVVKFRNLSDEEIDEYIATGEPLGMAGSYGIMDKGAVLIEGVKGNFYTIVGLPINLIYRELKKLGAI